MEIKAKYSIPYKGLEAGGHVFEFDIDNSLFEGRDYCEIKGGNAHARIEVQKGAEGLSLGVNILGTVVVECDRCVEDCPVDIEYDDRIKVKFSDFAAESTEDVICIAPGEDLDLTQYIYESIVLSLPYQRIHPSDENGIPRCNPDMLSRFKLVTQDEFDEITSPSAKIETEHEL